jgi:predicted RNase H-like HicB family nuclease
MRYAIVVEKAESNYAAYVPDLPGCVATGATVEETEARLREAIKLHIEGMREDGLSIPEPSSVVDYVETLAWFPDPERKDARDRRMARSRIGRWILRDCAGPLDPLVEIQTEHMYAALLSGHGEAGRSAAGMGSHPVLPPFADLDPRRGQLDQSPEYVGRRPSAALRMPEPFPDLVRFPIISGVE